MNDQKIKIVKLIQDFENKVSQIINETKLTVKAIEFSSLYEVVSSPIKFLSYH